MEALVKKTIAMKHRLVVKKRHEHVFCGFPHSITTILNSMTHSLSTWVSH